MYEHEFDADAQGGCGGATIAGYQGENWIWAALGLGAVGFLMRRRSLRGRALTVATLGALVGVGGPIPLPSSPGPESGTGRLEDAGAAVTQVRSLPGRAA
jgi:hypothetical protein